MGSQGVKKAPPGYIPVRPERFTEDEWGRLTPKEQARYSLNHGLFKPGESARNRRLDVQIDKLPVPRDSSGGKLVDRGRGGSKSTEVVDGGAPAFEVVVDGDLSEILTKNFKSISIDAFHMAAQANTANGTNFQKMVYIELLKKIPPMRQPGSKEKESAQTKKDNVRKLELLLASGEVQEGSFVEVSQ